VEIAGAALNTVGLVRVGAVLLKGAGFVAAGASIVDSVAAYLAFRRTSSKGDDDAAAYYGIASAFIGASAVAGIFAVVGGTTALVGGVLLLTPLGWAILLTAIGVGLMYMAMCAEDTAAEIWLDRCYWGHGKRLEDGRSAKWTDHQHDIEISEMNSLVLGAKAELGFNDNWNEVLTSRDTVSLRVTLPNYSSQGSAIALLATALPKRGQPHLLYYLYQGRPAPSHLPTKTDNGAIAYEPGKAKDEVDDKKNMRTIEQHFTVNSSMYDKVSISLDYWPDATDEEAVLSIRKLETD